MGLWNNKTEPEVKTEEVKAPEKTPAELIAESLGAALKPVTDTLSAINSRLDAVEQSTRKPERTVEPTEVPSVFDSEDAAFAHRIGPVMIRQFELEARMVRDDVRREYERAGMGDLWVQFEGEINRELEGSALVQPNGQGGVKPLRGDPAYIRNVVNMVIGRAAKEAGMRFDGTRKTFFLEGANGSAGNSGPEIVADGLTEEQRRVATRMGVSAKDASTLWGKIKGDKRNIIVN